MSECPEIIEKLEAYALDFLGGADREAVGAHLQLCGSCARELGEIRATLGLLENLPAQVALGGGARKVISTIADPPRARFPWAAAAGWLLAVGLGSLALWTAHRPVPPDPRVAILAGRIGDLQRELGEERARQARERDAVAARLDRQDELLRAIEAQGRRNAETFAARVADLGVQMKGQEERIQAIGEGLAALVRRNADDSERIAQLLRQVEGLKPTKPEPPGPEPAAKAEPPPVVLPPPPAEPPPNRNPVDAAQGFLLSVFRDRGGSLNQKIRSYKEELNRSYANR